MYRSGYLTISNSVPISNPPSTIFDASAMIPRALRHHAAGIFMLENIFGSTITLSTGRVVPVRFIGEQHVMEDLGRIPTVQDWLGKIQPESWMLGKDREHVSE